MLTARTEMPDVEDKLLLLRGYAYALMMMSSSDGLDNVEHTALHAIGTAISDLRDELYDVLVGPRLKGGNGKPEQSEPRSTRAPPRGRIH